MLTSGKIQFELAQITGNTIYNIELACIGSTNGYMPSATLENAIYTAVYTPFNLSLQNSNNFTPNNEQLNFIAVKNLTCNDLNGQPLALHIGTIFTGMLLINYTRGPQSPGLSNPWITNAALEFWQVKVS